MFLFTYTLVAGSETIHHLFRCFSLKPLGGTSSLIFSIPLSSIRMIVLFDLETLVSHEAHIVDDPDHDPVDWDAWLTPEALRDETDPSQMLIQRTSPLHSKWPKVSLQSDEYLQVAQSIDTQNEPITTNFLTLSPGVHASVKREISENLPFVNWDSEELESSKPSSTLGSEDYK